MLTNKNTLGRAYQPSAKSEKLMPHDSQYPSSLHGEIREVGHKFSDEINIHGCGFRFVLPVFVVFFIFLLKMERIVIVRQ